MRRTRRKPRQTATCASGIAVFKLRSSSTALYGCLSLSLSLADRGHVCACVCVCVCVCTGAEEFAEGQESSV
jgi:hypothetical protein